eukprot:scaffold220059_cov30-Tisochrysis_lutea.AAC.3
MARLCPGKRCLSASASSGTPPVSASGGWSPEANAMRSYVPSDSPSLGVRTGGDAAPVVSCSSSSC